MEFTERFTKVIEYSQLTPAEFAEEIGVQRSSISHIISGRNKPSLDFITKIKSSFPKFEWDWLINGEGEMLITDKIPEPVTEEKIEIVEKKKPSLPDLFSLIDDENFGKEDSTGNSEKNDNVRESNISYPKPEKNILSDSQPFEKSVRKQESKSNVKRIVFFYDDGTFETYEN